MSASLVGSEMCIRDRSRSISLSGSVRRPLCTRGTCRKTPRAVLGGLLGWRRMGPHPTRPKRLTQPKAAENVQSAASWDR
eukprot:15416964-Alexandrium_andersonii.AAC.1